MIEKAFLEEKYIKQNCSVADIATQLGCSQNKITYWLKKHGFKKRSISEALYIQKNPEGNPFSFRAPNKNGEWFLYGLALGLYWGEGNKKSKTAIRIGNTDPDLLRYFLEFLTDLYQVDVSRLRYGLQIFSDTSEKKAQQYWCKKLSIKPSGFQKIVVTPSRKKGTYTQKSEYGVLTIYFSNTKIRDIIVGAIEQLRKETYANVRDNLSLTAFGKNM